jgi:hypothetical protein
MNPLLLAAILKGTGNQSQTPIAQLAPATPDQNNLGADLYNGMTTGSKPNQVMRNYLFRQLLPKSAQNAQAAQPASAPTGFISDMI